MIKELRSARQGQLSLFDNGRQTDMGTYGQTTELYMVAGWIKHYGLCAIFSVYLKYRVSQDYTL